MKTRTLSTALFAGAFALFATVQANATTVVFELVNPGTAYPTYSSPTVNVGSGITTGTVNQNITGTIPNTQRSPFDLPGGAPGPTSGIDRYTAVLGGGSATYNIGQITTNPAALGISFLWGSPDSFNKVEFFNGVVSLGSVSSLNLTNPNGNPPTNAATGQSWVIVLADGIWTSVVFSSTTNAFEFASLLSACNREGAACAPGTQSNVPLPAALPLFAGGLGFLGFLARRKKQKAA